MFVYGFLLEMLKFKIWGFLLFFKGFSFLKISLILVFRFLFIKYFFLSFLEGGNMDFIIKYKGID